MPEAPRRAAPGELNRTGVLGRLVLAVAVGSLLLAIPPATSAAGSVTLTTPYPAVAVPPGEKVSFTMNVATDVSDRVDLSVAEVPEGWTIVHDRDTREASLAYVEENWTDMRPRSLVASMEAGAAAPSEPGAGEGSRT